MRNVKVHSATPNYVQEELQDELAALEGHVPLALQTSAAHGTGCFQTCIGAGAWALTLDEFSAARRQFAASLDCMSVHLRAIGHPGETIAFTLEGKPLETAGIDHSRTPRPDSWLMAMAMAFCFRRQDVIDILTAYPVDKLEPVSELERDPFWVPLCGAVQLYLLGDRGWRDAAGEAERLGQEAKIASPRLVASRTAVLPILRAVDAMDQAAFDDAVVAGLNAHKALEGRGRDKNSGVALFAGLVTGFTALGVERGLELGVTSGYMPEWLVRNEIP